MTVKIKNRITAIYQVILFFLFNLILVFLLNYALNKLPALNINPRIIEISGIVFFWGLLIFINVKVLHPQLKRKLLKRRINNFLLRTKSIRKRNKYVIPVLLVSTILFFGLGNLELILTNYTSPLTNVIQRTKWKRADNVDYSGLSFNAVDPEIIRSTSHSSDYGRFLRTYRWNQYIEKAEVGYNIPRGLLAGLIMQESYGNPLQLNSGNDGGAGLMMFQPGTARAYNLKVYGNSTKTGRDKVHGLAMRNLVKLNNYNYEKLAALDQRFHVARSIDAGARFLSDLYNKHRSWDDALSAYNRGTPAMLPQTTQHVRRVRYFQRQYLHYSKAL